MFPMATLLILAVVSKVSVATLLLIARAITFYQAMDMVAPASIHYGRAGADNIVCTLASEPSVSHPAADDLLHVFCNQHQGVNIARGSQYSTFYDAKNAHGNEDDGKRLYFTVTNQCAPNGIYLPLQFCLNGFTHLVAGCSPGDYESGRTSGGIIHEQCLAFQLGVQLKPAGGLDAEKKAQAGKVEVPV